MPVSVGLWVCSCSSAQPVTTTVTHMFAVLSFSELIHKVLSLSTVVLQTHTHHLLFFTLFSPRRYTKMKTATNIYIFNLALADSLVLVTLPFQGTDVFLGFWPFGNALCKTVISIDYYNMFTSTFTLTVMSIDRYVAVCHPVKALDMRTPHKAKVTDKFILCLLAD